MISRPVAFERFVGRAREREHLAERRREAARGHGGTILIAGDTGIGKTRLIEDFIAPMRRGPTRLAWVDLRTQTSNWLEALESIVDALDSPPVSTSCDTEALRFQRVLRSLEASAARRTTVLAFDNVEYATTAFVAALNAIASAAPRGRVLVIATYRDGAIHGEHPLLGGLGRLSRSEATTRIDLGPLPVETIESLVRFASETVSDRPAASTLAEIATRAEGNPLVAQELLRHELDRQRGHAADRALPLAIRARAQEQLAGLAPEDRAVLAAASVCGVVFDRAMLASVPLRPEADVERTLRCAIALGIIDSVTNDAFRFRHALTRDALYAEIARSEAVPMHERLARAIATRTGHEREIARHRFHAGHRDPDAGTAFECAAESARASSRFVEAIGWYDRAIEAFATSPHDCLRALIALAATLKAANETARVPSVNDRAIELARSLGDLGALVAIRKSIAGPMCNDGRHEAAVHLLETTLAEIPERGYARLRNELLTRIAQYRAIRRDGTDARATLARIDLPALDDDPSTRAEYFSLSATLAAQAFDMSAMHIPATRSRFTDRSIGRNSCASCTSTWRGRRGPREISLEQDVSSRRRKMQAIRARPRSTTSR